MPSPSSAPQLSTALSAQTPATVAWLGYAGLLPFAALAAVGLWAPAVPWWPAALLAYGAVILSFVGALHWGFAMALADLAARQRNACFVWSVVPSLLAWPAMLLPVAAGAGLLIVGFVAHLVQDFRLQHITPMAPWYLPLRARLTTVACICLALGAWAASAR